MEKDLWLPKGSEYIPDGNAVFGQSTRLEPKRSRQWLLDASEPVLFPSKKQAWDSSSEFTPVSSLPSEIMDRQFVSGTARPVTSNDRSSLIAATRGANLRKEVDSKQFQTDSLVGLSTSYSMEDIESGLSYGTARKVKVDQVKDPSNGLSTSYGTGILVEQRFGTAGERNFVHIGKSSSKEGGNSMLIGHSYDMGEANLTSLAANFNKNLDNTILMSDSYNKGDNHTLSFSGYQDDSVLEALGRPIGSYSLLFEQASVETSDSPVTKAVDVSSVSTPRSSKSIPKGKLEVKPARNEAPNSFPSNVRSLIATGILDGVPVRYVSVTREELRGIINGSGYLCGCSACDYSKPLNAYEFERHAGSKTKHPNNHIFLDNGKTIYQIVQELRSTPQSRLFDAIQTVTGSPINQKAFRTWKESFQAATREIQRIYAKEELNL